MLFGQPDGGKSQPRSAAATLGKNPLSRSNYSFYYFQ
jgi:hypothetical protein